MKTIEFNVPEYGWYNNGEGIDKDIVDIVKKYQVLKDNNARLLQENASLKSEHYKDEELIRLNNKNKELRASLTRGFGVSKEDQDKIDKFMATHECTKGQRLKGISSYRFAIIPGIGYNGYVKCSCGQEFCFYQE